MSRNELCTFSSSQLPEGVDWANFGNLDVYPMDRLRPGDSDDTLMLDRVAEIDRVDYLNAIDEINDSWRVLLDPRTGQTFEIAEANLDADTSDGVDVELSTFSSSISGNVGNAVEFAEHAALRPDRRRLYVASFGNGKTSYWSKEEQDYIKSAGRFTTSFVEDAPWQVLPTISALARVLEEQELPVTRISTNSAGGAYGAALMDALPKNQITHVYSKSRPNLSHHSKRALWAANMLVGDLLDDRKLQQASIDPWKLTDEITDAAKRYMPRIYSKDPDKNDATHIPQSNRTHGLKKMWTDVSALSHGQTGRKWVSPAAHDTVAAIRQHPDVKATFHFPTHDRLYNHEQEGERFKYDIARVDGVYHGTQVELLVMPGAHRDHTAYPALRWTVETYAFSR